ncbi:MAG: hypothetical protein FWC10_05945 [Lentimicrobiaceae bacterium]|nr:hypothetical protein [Lentimicrobiaceae bacterium]
MTEKKEFKGKWYIPESPEIKVAGILFFFPNETIKLELFGPLSAKDFIFQNNLHVIHGEVYTEKSDYSIITLFDCKASSSNNFSEVFPVYYYCNSMLLGRHLFSKTDAVFNRIRVYLPHFTYWCNRIQWKLEFGDNVSINNRDEYYQKYQINDDCCININIEASSFNGNDHFEYVLKTVAYIELENINKSNFMDLYNLMFWFKNFYSFAAMTAIPFTQVLFYDNDDFMEDENGNPVLNSLEKKIYNPTELFHTTEVKFKEKKTHSFLFTLNDIENDFETIIKNWYAKKEESKPIIGHLINSITYKKTFESIDFLIVIQAIEGYSLRFINEKNEKLRNLLCSLCEEYNDIKLINIDETDISKAVDSRNYYSHFFKSGKKKNVCKGLALFELTKKLKILLMCCVFSLIGFDNKEINRLLSHYNM